MTVITTGQIAKLLWPGLNAIWGTNYDEHPQEWPDLVDTFTSDMAYEEDQMLTGFGLAPVKPQGESTRYDTMGQGPTARYTHLAYSLGFIITHEAMVDNQYEKIGTGRTSSLAFSMRQTKENVVANVYNRAFNNAYVGADGVSLLNAAHPGTGGTFSNVLGTPADLSQASLEDLSIQIMNATNDRGMKIAIRPRTLIVPPSLYFDAMRLTQSTGEPGTANNDINTIRGLFPGGVKVNHYLTDTDAFFIRTDVPNGLKLFQRERATFSQDGDFDTDNLKYKAYERYSTGWTDPRALFGTPGA